MPSPFPHAIEGMPSLFHSLPAFFPFISYRAWQHYGENPRQSKEKVIDLKSRSHRDVLVDSLKDNMGHEPEVDTIRYFSAVRAEADCMISRDARAFATSDLPVLTPQELLPAGLPGD